jgi:hypothetical protein
MASKASVAVKKRSGEKDKQEKAEICQNCQSKVKDDDDGIQCDICMVWFHSECEDVSQEMYKEMAANKQLHWYCKACNRGLVSVVKDCTGIEKHVIEASSVWLKQ